MATNPTRAIQALIVVFLLSELCLTYYQHHHGHHSHRGHHHPPPPKKNLPEYYSLLGVPLRSDIKVVKRAFKKMAIKFHPDKAPTGKREEYQKKYTGFSDAYNILSDPEKKQMYDAYGHDGLEELNMREQQKAQHEARKEAHQDRMSKTMFQGTEIFMINEETINRFLRRIGVWLVLFYRDSDKESWDYREPFVELASKFTDIFTVGVVNCNEEENICDEYSGFTTPIVKVFTHDYNHKGTNYGGLPQVPSLAGFAVGFLEDHVRIITNDNFDGFLAENHKLPKLFLYTNKKATPPILKVLSREFKSNLAIGVIKNDQALIRRLPKQLTPPVIFSIGSEISDLVVYEGPFRKAQMSSFIREKITEYTERASSSSVEIRTVRDLTTSLCSSISKKTCLISIFSDEEEELIKSSSSELAELVKSDPIIVLTISKGLIDLTKLRLKKEEPLDNVSSILINPSKKKLHLIKGQFNSVKLRNTVDLALSGGISYARFEGNIEDAILEEDSTDL